MYNGSVVKSDEAGSVYSYLSGSDYIRKRSFDLSTNLPVVQYGQDAGRITLNRDLTASAMGKDEHYLYAISSEANRLLQIDTDTFQVIQDRYIGSHPTDVDIRDDIIYDSLGGSTHIAKIDTLNETDFMAPITEIELTSDVAKDKTDKISLQLSGDQIERILSKDVTSSIELEGEQAGLIIPLKAIGPVDNQDNVLYSFNIKLLGASSDSSKVLANSHLNPIGQMFEFSIRKNKSGGVSDLITKFDSYIIHNVVINASNQSLDDLAAVPLIL